MSQKNVLIIRSNSDYHRLFSLKSVSYRVMDEHSYKDDPDIIVYTGGPDVSPSLYGEKQLGCTRPDTEIEKRYKEIYDRHPNAVHLGICFGGQWLNVINGGAMWQDVSNHAISGTHPVTNLLRVPSGVLLRETFHVTSTHHQMMIAGPEGEVLAIAESDDILKKGQGRSDRFITAKDGGRDRPKYDTEVVYYPKTKSLCFQPHPEFHGVDDCKRYFFALTDYLFDL